MVNVLPFMDSLCTYVHRGCYVILWASLSFQSIILISSTFFFLLFHLFNLMFKLFSLFITLFQFLGVDKIKIDILV